MAQSPATPTPYEILGVPATASQDDLRRAYRRMLRLSHPDMGGDAERFQAVQDAWQRVGDPARRAAYDRGSGPGSEAAGEPFSAGSSWPAGRPGNDGPTTSSSGPHHSASWRARPGGRAGSPLAKTYGFPGARARERFLTLIEEWAGRGSHVEDPYDVSFVRSAPPEIRQELAKAMAEEETARQLAALGIGFTVWNAVAGWDDDYQIDHVVLGPAGLFAIHSADWGCRVALTRAEVTGDALAHKETPLADLAYNARKVAHGLGVRFTASIVVVPDDDVDDIIDTVRRGRLAGSCLVARSALPGVLRGTIGVAADRGTVATADLMEVRTRLQQGLELVPV
ncbi:MAG TPA: DnaJ domain-containing protein [Microbacteriaceae bacterium]|nr:DnaJ domain-containing protein [Microbacteriaceae bacterium]